MTDTIPSTPLIPAQKKPTTFQEMYDFFLSGITDDMFMEMTKEDTEAMLQEILVAAVPRFEFPRWGHPFDLDLENKVFTTTLTIEEKIIIRYFMISEWLSFQLANVDLVRQKYSSSDFSFTSQASHMKQLTNLKQEYERQAFHMQRLYCRRRPDKNGIMRSTFADIMEPAKWR